MSIIFNGRPQDKRIPKEERVYDMLDLLGVEFFRADHEPTASMDQCNEAEQVLGIHICKNLFLCTRNKSQYYMLVMPGDKPFKTKELSSQIGSSRLSFASGEDMEKYLDITPGSVSILGLMNDTENKVKLLVDEDILRYEWFGCHPCINTSSLKIRTKDMFDIIIPHISHEPTFVKLIG